MNIDEPVNSTNAYTILEKILDSHNFVDEYSIINSNDTNIICKDCKEHDKLSSIQATRYCRRCKTCICTDCAIENHHEHIAEAKLKLSDVLGSHGKEEWKALQINLDESIKSSNYGKKISETLSAATNETEIFVKDVLISVDSLKGKLDSFADSLNAYKSKLNSDIKENMKILCSNSIYNGLDRSTILFIYYLAKHCLTEIWSDWEKVSSTQKINLLQYKKQIEQEISNGLESLDKYSLSALSNKQKQFDVEERDNLQSKLQNIEHALIELNKYLQKVTLIKDKTVRERSPRKHKSQEKQSEPDNSLVINPRLPKPELPILYPLKQPEYLLGIKTKSSEIFAFPIGTPDTDFKILKINSNSFTDKYSFPIFPLENSKYVYLNDSILVTGGSEKNYAYENCYLISLNSFDNIFGISITNYAPMKEKRERHNIIYVEHLGAVIVCSGFYTKTCEINYLNYKQEWELLQPMREFRANATMFCVNNRFVYCVGGFQVLDRDVPRGGVYLNSLEFIDTNDLSGEWKYLELMSLNINLKLCAMGVINYNSNRILLVGGYDGEKYLTELNECIFDPNGNLMKINQNGLRTELGRGVIFTSNQKFSHSANNKMINFDSNCRMITFDQEKGNFSFKV